MWILRSTLFAATAKKLPIPLLLCSRQLPTSPGLFLLLSGWLEAVDEPGDDDALGYAGSEQQSSADQLPLVDVEVGVIREDAVPIAWKSVNLNFRLPVLKQKPRFWNQALIESKILFLFPLCADQVCFPPDSPARSPISHPK